MVPSKTVTLVALACAVATGLSGCLGRSASTTTAVTSTTIAATAAIANLAPTTLVGADPAPGAAPSADPATLSTPLSSGADPTTAKGLPTPQAAARNLWDAWRDADGPRALLYATASATEVVMATAWGPEVHQSGCTAIEAGWLCRFEGPTVRWDLDIAGDDTLGYHVRRVTTGEPNGILLVPGVSPTQAAAAASSVPDAFVTTTSEVPGSGSGFGARTAKRRRTSTTRKTRTTAPITKPTGAQASGGPPDTAPTPVTPAQPAQPAIPPAAAPAPVPVANPAQNVG